MSRPGAGPVASGPSRTSRMIVVLCLIAGAVAWSRLGREYLAMFRPSVQASPDFYQDWASARNYLSGLPVYSPHAVTMPLYLRRPQEDWEKDISHNAHPPTSVLLALPLTGLELPDAVLAWNIFTVGAFLASLAIVAAGLPELKTLFLPVGVLLPFCLPVYGNIQQGQLTFVLVLLITSAWALDRSGRPGAAGLLVGTAAAVKLFPAYLVVYFAARGRWRGVFSAAAAFGALTLATVAILGWAAYRDYWQVVLPTLAKFRSYAFNLSFFGFWHKLFDPASERGWITPIWYSPAATRIGAADVGPGRHGDRAVRRPPGANARAARRRLRAGGRPPCSWSRRSPGTTRCPCCWSRSPSSPAPRCRRGGCPSSWSRS